ncbi:ABC-2 family transporter protein [Evansella caseinilytica]|uniref:ABC-2 family transporter protein n=1 Tax=Evansella caseinilytica TaxID=1503961 RepID=A0A1H3TWR9_9BACI|nr:ABC transporter permease [Evansella caseinilytica]SDZ53689.1 ABC-2 family transporter protein [Evansella caseinilytica]
MKSIIMTIVRELKLIFRDGITIYLTISPAVLALIFIFVFGSVQESNISLTVDKSLPQDLVTKLESVADIEYVDNLERLKERVSGVDSIAGVTMEDGNIRLIVEGNEAQGFAESRQKLVSAALDTELIPYTAETVEAQASLAYTISMACIFLLALFIGGSSFGLSGVSERESGVIRAVSVSPMTLGGYVISKIIPSLLLGMIGVSACTLIMGRVDALPQFLLLALCSVFVSGMIIFLIVAFAGNQIAAVGVLKIVMPLFLMVGISAVFIPERWIFLYYVFPMYWQYAVIDTVISNGEATFQFLMILVTGFAWFIPVMIVFTKKVKMKAWR